MAHEAFDAGWLELREPIDHRSRSPELAQALAERWKGEGWATILDLGAGTGSNLRYLSPRLVGPQRWTLLDHDARLLSMAVRGSDLPTLLHRTNSTLRCLRGDLDGAGIAEIRDAHLVTASALLDLVSERWVERLVGECRAVSASIYVALTYDGTIRWDPNPASASSVGTVDREIRDAVSEHQRRDKGMGTALGPTATDRVETHLRSAGYHTLRRPSPWMLGAADSQLAGHLIRGWVAAASDVRPDRAVDFQSWGVDRISAISEGHVRLEVGHQDLLALP